MKHFRPVTTIHKCHKKCDVKVMDPTRASKRTRKRPRVRASCQLIAAVSIRINSRRLCLDLCAEPEMFW